MSNSASGESKSVGPQIASSSVLVNTTTAVIDILEEDDEFEVMREINCTHISVC